VACVGDSITAGFGFVGVKDSYPAHLQALMGKGCDVQNFGVSATTLVSEGDYPYTGRPQYKAALDFRPEVLVVMLGTNDTKHPNDGSLDATNASDNWRFRDKFVGEYEALIASFRRANPAVRVYVCLPPPANPGRWGINGKTILNGLIPLVKRVAKEAHANLIDLYTPFKNKPQLIQADTVHPNVQGNEVIASIVGQALSGKPVRKAGTTGALAIPLIRS
jgi:lysophospholipase L1-like esterase